MFEDTRTSTRQLFTSMGKLIPPQRSKELLNTLIADIQWQDAYFVFERRFTVPRLQAWYADAGIHYRHSNNFLQSQIWTPLLLSLKTAIERKSACSFNSVLITYYRSGEDHVTWHADDERELGTTPVIASFSLGATRRFCYRHKRQEKTGEMPLRDNELIVMHPRFQRDWEHCVPVQTDITDPRINLTFRNVVNVNS